jgi:hypothetical protein
VGSGKEELTVYGGSKTRDVEERSVVLRSFITNAWPPAVASIMLGSKGLEAPPMALADPGRTKEVVTPPAIESA